MESKTNEEAKSIILKFDVFDGTVGHYWTESHDQLIVRCEPFVGGWTFSRLAGDEWDFQHLIGNKNITKVDGPPMLLPLLTIAVDPLEEIRDLCKSEFLDNRQRGFRHLADFVDSLKIGELVSIGLAENDDKIKHLISDIIISLYSGSR